MDSCDAVSREDFAAFSEALATGVTLGDTVYLRSDAEEFCVAFRTVTRLANLRITRDGRLEITIETPDEFQWFRLEGVPSLQSE